MGVRSLLACVRAHKDLPAFCQFFALLPNFVISRPLFAYWACGKSAESALHVIFPQCTACSIPSVHCTQAHKHSSLGCLQTNISSSPSLAPVSVSCCGQASSPWDGTTFYTKYCTSAPLHNLWTWLLHLHVLKSSVSSRLEKVSRFCVPQNPSNCPIWPSWLRIDQNVHPAQSRLEYPWPRPVMMLSYRSSSINPEQKTEKIISSLWRDLGIFLHSTATQQRASEQ